LLQYTLRRILISIPTLIGVLVIVFMMVRLAPGDPAVLLAGEFASPEVIERARARFGLDRSYPEQFVRFISGLVQGDLGRSTRTNRLVTDDLANFFPNTLELALAAIVVALIVGIPAGVVSALRPNGPLDFGVTFVALLGVSMPVFWFGLLAILFFSVQLGWFPVAGRGTLAAPGAPGHHARPVEHGDHRAHDALVDARGAQPGLRAHRPRQGPPRPKRRAQARAAQRPRAGRDGGRPPVRRTPGRAVITETVFTWPGIGRLLVDSIRARDYPVVQGSVLLIAVSFMLVNLVVDLIYGFIDPRIRYD
jgi:peptide/nickel transport system permease protein